MPEKTALPLNAPETDFAAALIKRIGHAGPVSVADYMQACVSEYYARAAVFGTAGDFITAPEISQMFGEMIAAWLTDLWLQAGKPDQVNLVELGPGRGTLMVDIMRTLANWPDFKNAIQIHLVETSPTLREKQAIALNTYTPHWHDSLRTVPQGMTFVVANEFLDALPIHQLQKVKGEWHERCVGFDGAKFFFTHRALPAGLKLSDFMPADFMAAPDNSIFEVSPASLGVVAEVAARLKQSCGAALFIDYGHDRSGLGDTLQAVEKHTYADVLEKPGQRDITAHVDFAACVTAAQDAGGVRVHGPCTQGAFLTRLGIATRANALRAGAEDVSLIEAALSRLIAPNHMGVLFKVLGLSAAASNLDPAGFSDEVHTP